ncbi:MAG: acyltransferase [Sphingobacteriia bacterium]|nr:acyltransferase [Sphingobacteriia bacterium]
MTQEGTYNKIIRLKHIDALRGIASFMVFMLHVSVNPVFSWFNSVKLSNLFQFGKYGVDIFFVISGFVIPYAMFTRGFSLRKDFRSFFLRRLTRIELPYVVSIAFVLLLTYLSASSSLYQGQKNIQIDFSNIPAHLTYTNYFFGKPYFNDVYWTLAIEIQYYIFVCFIFRYILQKEEWVFVLLLLFINIPAIFLKEYLILPRYLPIFSVGFLLLRNITGHQPNNPAFVYVILFALLLFNVYINGMASSVFTLLAFCWIRLNHINYPSWLLWLGKISFSLYLIHIPVSSRIQNLASRFIPHSTVYALLIIISTIAITLFIAWVYFLLIEQPFQKLSKKIA